MATSAGHPGRPNEDFVGAVPSAVALLDGAGIPGTESICHHGVAWYTHRLGGALLARLSRDDGRDLTAVLGDAIDEIAASHRGTCDIANPSSPQATVAIARLQGSRLDYLLLADSFLILDQVSGGPLIITDEREVTARRHCTAPLAGVARGTAEYERIRDQCIEALQARRNHAGGYWIAKDDPRAAGEAVTGTGPLRDLHSAALLSNGASRIVSPYALTSWPGLLELLSTGGPEEIIRRVREAEASNCRGPAADSHRPAAAEAPDTADQRLRSRRQDRRRPAAHRPPARHPHRAGQRADRLAARGGHRRVHRQPHRHRHGGRR